jgi:hypothetical protein
MLSLSLTDAAAFCTLQAGSYQIGFDAASGGLAYLLDTLTGTQWSDFGSGILGQLTYRTYSQSNFTDFMIAYNYVWLAFIEDDLDDYDKVGIDAAGAVYQEINATLQVQGLQALCCVMRCQSISTRFYFVAGHILWRREWHRRSTANGSVSQYAHVSGGCGRACGRASLCRCHYQHSDEQKCADSRLGCARLQQDRDTIT